MSIIIILPPHRNNREGGDDRGAGKECAQKTGMEIRC